MSGGAAHDQAEDRTGAAAAVVADEVRFVSPRHTMSLSNVGGSETCEGRAADSLYRSSSVPSFYARPHLSRAYHARYDTSSVLQHPREMDRTRRTSGTRRPRWRRPGARRTPRRQDRPVVPLLSQDRSVRRDRSDGEGWTGRVLEWPAQIPCTCGQ